MNIVQSDLEIKPMEACTHLSVIVDSSQQKTVETNRENVIAETIYDDDDDESGKSQPGGNHKTFDQRKNLPKAKVSQFVLRNALTHR